MLCSFASLGWRCCYARKPGRRRFRKHKSWLGKVKVIWAHLFLRTTRKLSSIFWMIYLRQHASPHLSWSFLSKTWSLNSSRRVGKLEGKIVVFDGYTPLLCHYSWGRCATGANMKPPFRSSYFCLRVFSSARENASFPSLSSNLQGCGLCFSKKTGGLSLRIWFQDVKFRLILLNSNRVSGVVIVVLW